MKERIQLYIDDFGINVDMSKLLVTTFNSFGQQLINEEYETFGYTRIPEVIDNVKRYSIIADLLNKNEIEGIDYRNFNTIKIPSQQKGALEIVARVFDIIKFNNLTFTPNDINILEEKLGGDGNFIDSCAYEKVFELFVDYEEELRNINKLEYADQENLIKEILIYEPYFLERSEERRVGKEC